MNSVRRFADQCCPAPFFPVVRAAVTLVLVGSRLLAAPGSVEEGFRFTSGDGSQGTGAVRSAVLQPDGKVFIIGNYRSLNDRVQVNLTRVAPDGTVDTAFPILGTMGNSNGINSTAVLPDGRIIVGTQVRFLTPTDHTAPYGRVLPDGTEDTTFNGPLTDNVFVNRSLPDGKLLIGGDFSNADKPRYVMRLTQTGGVDTQFQARVDGLNPVVNTMAIQEDGRIVLGGTFTRVGGAPRAAVARLHADGRLDADFRPNFPNDTIVQALALQSDGRILVGEGYRNTSGGYQTRLVRLHPDGSRDGAFEVAVESNEFASFATSLAVQSDGKILVAGQFLTVNGQPRRGVARVHADGTLDEGFVSPLTDGSLHGLTLERDGRIMVAGNFRISGGPTLYSLVRLRNDPSTQELAIASTRRIVWRRGGSAPETHHVWFELSVDDGVSWSPLGAGVRTADGWELGGLSLPRVGTLRARAVTYTGMRNGSQSLIESVANYTAAPEIAVHAGATTDAPELVAGQLEVVDFGEARLGVPVVRAFTIANTGTAPLLVNRLAAPVGFAWRATPVVPFEIEPGGLVVVEAQLEAAALGFVAGTMAIESDDGDEARFQFPVTGLVTAPEIAVHAGATTAAPELTAGQSEAVDFGAHVQGTPGSRFFTVGNTGTAALLITSIAVPPGYDLTPAPVLPASIDPGGSAVYKLRLVSMTPGVHAGSVVLHNDDADESAFDFPVTGSVFIPAPVVTRPAPGDGAETTINRQTGLREQSIRLTNDTTATVPAYRIWVRGLPDGVTLANASESLGNGVFAVWVRQQLGPFSSANLVLEFSSADRRPLASAPELSVEVLLNPPDDTAGDGSGTFAIERMVWLSESGGLLLEFESAPGLRYTIEYSDDGTNWRASPGYIRGTGNRTQWIDRGPPHTASPPSMQGTRFYRVLQLAE